MEFYDPYDLTQHLTEDFYTNLHSAKWSERRDAIQSLIDVAKNNPLFMQKDTEMGTLISELSKIFSSDNNINVAACAAQMFVKIAQGASGIFKHDAPAVILTCLQRSKEAKPVIKNVCLECLDAAYATTTFASVIESIKGGLGLKAPGSKIQTCEFFTRIMLKIDFPTAKKSASASKEVINLLCKLAMGSDPACREASMRSLAAFMRAVTKQVAMPLLSTIASDKLKMTKIEEFYNQFIVDHPFDDGTSKQPKKIEKPAVVEVSKQSKQNEKPTAVVEVSNKIEEVKDKNVPSVHEKSFKSPTARNQLTSHSTKSSKSIPFQKMNQIVSDELASVPLESLLNLNHVMPRRLGTVQVEENDDEAFYDEEFMMIDPKETITDALENLKSSQMSLANSAIVALTVLVQSPFSQKALASKASSIFVAVIGKFNDLTELYNSDDVHSIENKDCEDYLRQATNFLLKFIPQLIIASSIDDELFNLLTSSLLVLSTSFAENSSQRQDVQSLLNCISESVPINTVLLNLIKMTEKLMNICVYEEIDSPDKDFRQTKDGFKLGQTVTCVLRALESCVQNKKRHDEVNVFAVHRALSGAMHLIINPPANVPQNSNIKATVGYAFQKFIKTNLIQTLIVAVRFDENERYAEYVLKIHQTMLHRELSKQGEDKVGEMLCGYTNQLVKRFGEKDFTFALESLYGLYKNCLISSRFKVHKSVFDKTINASVFAPVIEDTLLKMDATYMAGDELDIEEYLFSTFMTGPTLELYQTTQKLCKLILSKPNMQELDDLQLENDLLDKIVQFDGSMRGINDLIEPLGAVSLNRAKTATYRIPEHSLTIDDSKMNSFKAVVNSVFRTLSKHSKSICLGIAVILLFYFSMLQFDKTQSTDE